MDNIIEFGIENLHYAIMNRSEDGQITYGTPKRIPNAVSVNLKVSGNEFKKYADNRLVKSTFAKTGYNGDIVITNTSDDMLIEVFGDKKDENGVLVENADAKTKEVALLVEFDGDEKKARHVLYNVKLGRPSIEYETKTEQDNPKDKGMSITVSPHPVNKNIKSRCDQDKAKYNDFFKEVYEPVFSA